MTPELPEKMARRVIRAVAARRGVGVRDIAGPSRLPNIVSARHEAMRSVFRYCQPIKLKEMAFLFDRHHSTILYALGRLTGRLDVM